MDITRVVPTPEPVMVAGAVRLVWPLRLRDVATLQAWLRIAAPSPLALALADIASGGLEGKARHRRLREAYDLAEAWPPRYGSPEADRRFATHEGICFFLSVVAERSRWTPDELAEVLAKITRDEYAALARSAFGPDPLDELGRLMGLYDEPEADEDAPRDDLNWAEAFAEAAEATGWTFDQVADLTVPQWVAFRSGGKPARAAEIPPGMTVADYSRRQHRRFYADQYDDEGAGA